MDQPIESSEVKSPTIVVENDYDGYFESLVRRWVNEKTTPFIHKEIRVTSGPWRPYAVNATQPTDNPGVIRLDFYAALRRGFGELSNSDVKRIQDLL